MEWGAVNYFYLLCLIPFIAIFYILAFWKKKRALKKFASPDILEKLIPSISFGRQYFRAFLMIFALVLLIISLARPQYGVKEELVTHRGVDIILAIDTSDSMMAEDISPNRLDAVKIAVQDLLGRLQGDRVGLVLFSGESFLNCPLTIDYGALEMFIEIMDTDIIPQPGTNIEKAIETAQAAFETKERQYKVLIIMTDGENHQGNPVGAAKKAAEEGIVIYTIGLGSPEGAPIPVKDGEGRIVDTKRDRQGEQVISRLDEGILKDIAREGNGKYFRVTSSGNEIEEICSEILNMEKKDFQSKLYTTYVDRFQYPLFMAFILILWEFFFDERKKSMRKWSGRFE